MKMKVEAKAKQMSNPNAKRNADFCWQISILKGHVMPLYLVANGNSKFSR